MADWLSRGEGEHLFIYLSVPHSSFPPPQHEAVGDNRAGLPEGGCRPPQRAGKGNYSAGEGQEQERGGASSEGDSNGEGCMVLSARGESVWLSQ